ncbi:MAG: septum formation inhibitor Maf [Gammaproteobacteria bacterium]|nr:septum formation inhibitor Maf [Gammaproteobacteria bacterium]
MNQSFIILASASPRRARLLQQLGVSFIQEAARIDESVRPGESPEEHVARLSIAKCKKVITVRDDCTILGSDTVVVADNEILGKPQDQQDHARMLRSLSARTHRVCTGVTLMSRSASQTEVNISEVTMRSISAQEISRYWHTGEPCDKAGGYAIQGFGAAFISHIAGSYSGIMGLPVFETAQMLESFGHSVWNSEVSL